MFQSIGRPLSAAKSSDPLQSPQALTAAPRPAAKALQPEFCLSLVTRVDSNKQELIASAMSAAPLSVAKDATIVAVGSDGKLRTHMRGRRFHSAFKGTPLRKTWQSDYSGSTPVTPARTPERPSEEPAINAWRNLTKKMMRDTGWSEERSIELKCLPEGRRAIARVVEAAEAALARS
jgi:hypothetical protein